MFKQDIHGCNKRISEPVRIDSIKATIGRFPLYNDGIVHALFINGQQGSAVNGTGELE